MKKPAAPTHHIAAQPGDFAKTVLMPGDPLRAQYIAQNFLDGARQVNGIRCLYAYTGSFRGKPVSVMASGIGAPSMGVHAWELFELYDVQNIIRIGTTGAMTEVLAIGDLVIAMGACYNTCYADQYRLPGVFSATASYPLLKRATESADRLAVPYTVGSIFSTDIFYEDAASPVMEWTKMGVLAVEMETAALYTVAARAGRHAVSLLTVSDSLVTHEKTSAEVRQTKFTAMMDVALDMAATLEEENLDE